MEIKCTKNCTLYNLMSISVSASECSVSYAPLRTNCSIVTSTTHYRSRPRRALNIFYIKRAFGLKAYTCCAALHHVAIDSLASAVPHREIQLSCITCPSSFSSSSITLYTCVSPPFIMVSLRLVNETFLDPFFEFFLDALPAACGTSRYLLFMCCWWWWLWWLWCWFVMATILPSPA